MEFHSAAGRWMLEGDFFAQMFANGFWNSRPQLSIKTYLITRHLMQVCLIQFSLSAQSDQVIIDKRGFQELTSYGNNA